MRQVFSDRRIMQLGEIIYSTRHGIIDGVEIDLRHQALKQKDWRAAGFGAPPGIKHRDIEEPFVWFPWFGDFDGNKLKRKAMRLFASGSNKREILGADSLEEYVKNNTPECFIYAGDKLCIETVFGQKVADAYENKHNAEIRLARLNIIRKGAAPQIVPTMAKFVSTKNITSRVSYDLGATIAANILEHFGLKNLDQIDTIVPNSSYAYRALLSAYELDPELEFLRRISPASGNFLWSENFSRVLNEAMLLGYFWGKAEADITLKPALQAHLRKSSIGGKNATKKRAEESARNREIARGAAEGIWKSRPSFSQSDVAEDVQKRWAQIAGPKGATPVLATIEKYLKGMVSPVKLAKRAALVPRKKT